MDTAKTERAPLKVRKDRTDRPVKTKAPDARSKEAAQTKGYDFTPKVFKYKVEYRNILEASANWIELKQSNNVDEARAVIKAKHETFSKMSFLEFRIWDNVKNAPVEG